MRAQTLSYEHKRNISEAVKKVWADKAKRKQMLEARTPWSHTYESKQKISETHKGKTKSKVHRIKLSEAHIGMKHPHSEETKIKIGIANFKYGCKETWHTKAWKLFGLDFCEICGMTLDECLETFNRRFDMHCTLEPKDYSVMEVNAWQCLCKACHGHMEGINGGVINKWTY